MAAPSRTQRRGLVATAVLVSALAIGGCTAAEPPAPSPGSGAPSATSAPTGQAPALQPVGEPRDLATGLDVPWSVVRLSNGSALISERDSGRVLEFTATGELREAGAIEEVVAGGEGGLLGLAVGPGERELHAYFTAADDNRIVRMPLTGRPGALGLGAARTVLTGIPKAGNHNGGRLAFGPDGMLYATTGDAGLRERARDAGSLAGKILRMRPDGAVPSDNPLPGSLVFSRGHRNPQGLAWDAEGRLWASEFGQNTWDELNVIVAGGDYGWPTVEGIAGREGLIDPVVQWHPDEASPSGIAFVGSTLFVATLRGQTVWSVQTEAGTGSTIDPDQIEVVPWLRGDLGRLRDAIAGPDGTLWLLTNNTARGTPREGDDRLVELRLREPLAG